VQIDILLSWFWLCKLVLGSGFLNFYFFSFQMAGEYVWDELDVLMDGSNAVTFDETGLNGAGDQSNVGSVGPGAMQQLHRQQSNWDTAALTQGQLMGPAVVGGSSTVTIPGSQVEVESAAAFDSGCVMDSKLEADFAQSTDFMNSMVMPPAQNETTQGASKPATSRGVGKKRASPASPSSKGKKLTKRTRRKKGGSAEGEDDDELDKDAKRRAAVAAASRATRAKRKKEMEDLKEKNLRLEDEREMFLNTIADLQMKVQALRETGSIDLRMENDLLRAELMEHKNFISKFKRIADGMPTTTSAKKLMCKQGSDTAIAQVLGLLSTSMADPSWKLGIIEGHPQIEMRYQRLPLGVSANNAKRCSVRVDVPVIPADDPIEIAEIIWATWCDEDLNKRISKHFGAVSVSVREIDTGIDNLNSNVSDRKAGESLKNRVKVYYYREETPRVDDGSSAGEGKSNENDVVDTVLLLSSREKSISRSSFPQDMRFHRFPPDPEREKALYEGRLPREQPLTLEEQQGLEGQRSFNAIVLASTSTQHSLGLVPVKPGVHRIRSALLEGAVFRKVEGGVAMSSVFSFPTQKEGRPMAHHEILVTDDGKLNAQWSKVVCEMYDIVRESMRPAVFEKFRAARDAGVPFPKQISDYL